MYLGLDPVIPTAQSPNSVCVYGSTIKKSGRCVLKHIITRDKPDEIAITVGRYN